MESQVVLTLSIVFVTVLIGAIIDSWNFRLHYIVMFPMVISTAVYLGMQDEGAALQDSLVIGFVGTWVLLCLFAVGNLIAGAGADEAAGFECDDSPIEHQEPNARAADPLNAHMTSRVG